MECCLYCGRDTASQYKICARCTGGAKPAFFSQINDTKDRQTLAINCDNPILDDLEYTDYYKTIDAENDWGKKSTERFIKRMNK
jgi:hypothetical protein